MRKHTWTWFFLRLGTTFSLKYTRDAWHSSVWYTDRSSSNWRCGNSALMVIKTGPLLYLSEPEGHCRFQPAAAFRCPRWQLIPVESFMKRFISRGWTLLERHEWHRPTRDRTFGFWIRSTNLSHWCIAPVLYNKMQLVAEIKTLRSDASGNKGVMFVQLAGGILMSRW